MSFVRCFVSILLSLSVFASSVFAQAEFLSLQKRIQELFAQSEGAVVRVKAYHLEKENPGNAQPKITLRVGTGFFISREGLLLVNASRVKGAERVTVEHQGTDYLAEIVGMDEQVNVALLKAVYLPDSFEFLRMNESPSLPEPGTLALAITCPYTFAPSPKLTMISGHDTKFLRVPFPTTYMRVDTPLHQGEGGGPVIDLQGRMIGMLLASLPETQSSYVLPASAINKIKDDLLLEGRVSYASVGIEVGQHFIRGGQSRVKILEVVPDSPAEMAGIQKDDIVTKVGDYPIKDFSDFPNAMFFIRVGEYVDIEVERSSEKIAFNMPTIRRSAEDRFIKIEPMSKEDADKAREESKAMVEEARSTDSAEKTSELVDNPLQGASINIPLSPQTEEAGPKPPQ